MKALLILDDDEALSALDSFLRAHRFDTIMYRWFLKALDNLEEVAPDLIIISVKDYPRHWKTLAGFIKSGIAGKECGIILFSPHELSSDEKEKARALGVAGILYSYDTGGLNGLEKILEACGIAERQKTSEKNADRKTGEDTAHEKPACENANGNVYDESESVPTVSALLDEAHKTISGSGLLSKTKKIAHEKSDADKKNDALLINNETGAFVTGSVCESGTIILFFPDNAAMLEIFISDAESLSIVVNEKNAIQTQFVMIKKIGTPLTLIKNEKS